MLSRPRCSRLSPRVKIYFLDVWRYEAPTEKQIAQAEDQRKNAETARAAADNAYRQAIGLTPEQYVQLKRIEMEVKVCSEGKCTFIENAGAMPALSLATH